MSVRDRKVYIAGSLFKEGDQAQRLREEAVLRKHGVSVYNPISADVNDKSKLPTAWEIVEKDFGEILSCDGMLVGVDDVDMGVSCEVGMCYGMNYVLEILRKMVMEDVVGKEGIERLLREIPMKRMYGHHSDIRIGTAHEYRGNYVPYGVNQFYIGAIERYGKVYGGYVSAVEGIVREDSQHERRD